jgi:hypothetical protein
MTTLKQDSNYNVMQIVGFGTTQSIAIGASSVQSAATALDTDLVRIVCTSDCNVAIGANPTASATTSAFLPAGIVEYVEITGGQKVAVIQKTGGSAGTLFITEGL